MRKLITLIGTLCISLLSLMAQTTGTIRATLKDANTKQGVNGAVIELVKSSDGSEQYYSSGYNGTIEIKRVVPGSYKMTITYLGYKDYVKELKVVAGRRAVEPFAQE